MGSIADLGSQAGELAPEALKVLAELMGDQSQTGPVRVAAAKSVIDYALRLSDREQDDTLSKLDAALEDLRNIVMVEDQG